MNLRKLAVVFLLVLVAVAIFLLARNPPASTPETPVEASSPSAESGSSALPGNPTAPDESKAEATGSVTTPTQTVPTETTPTGATPSTSAAPAVTADSPSAPPAATPKATKASVFIPTKRAGKSRGQASDSFSIPTKSRQSHPIGHYGEAAPVRVKSKDELDRVKPKSYSGNPEDLLIEGEKKLSRPQD